MFPVNYQSRQRSFQSYRKPRKHYALRELSQLTTLAFRATKFLSPVGVGIPVNCSFQNYRILSTLGIDIPVDCSFRSYRNFVNCQSWQPKFSELPKTSYTSHQLSELRAVAIRAVLKKKNIISSLFGFKFLFKRPYFLRITNI